MKARMAARDQQDRNRSIAPLKPPEDAVFIDSTGLDFDSVLSRTAAEVDLIKETDD